MGTGGFLATAEVLNCGNLFRFRFESRRRRHASWYAAPVYFKATGCATRSHLRSGQTRLPNSSDTEHTRGRVRLRRSGGRRFSDSQELVMAMNGTIKRLV